MKKSIFIVALLFAAFTSRAQSPWSVGFHYSAMDFRTPYIGTSDQTQHWNTGAGVTVGYRLAPYLTLAGNFTLTDAKKMVELNKPNTTNPGSVAPRQGSSLSTFGQVGAQLHFMPLFGKEAAAVDPYAIAQVGLHDVEKVSYGSVGGGLGINFWFSEGAGFYVQSTYNAMPLSPKANTLAGNGPLVYFNHNAGLRFRLGTDKDTDKDGVSDKKDKCPEVPGKKEMMGCPDQDNDGLADADDSCPTEAGTKEMMGCPDKDGDGIADKDDKCPDVKGVAAFSGCADTDGDGIADPDDKCPTEAGVAALQGCPDKDGDGIADADDACPTEAGVADLQGCPDRDKDGVADKDDKCPDVFGVKNPGTDKHGCPKTKDEAIEELKSLAKSIQFETGKDIIRSESFSSLDQVAGVMNDFPEAKFAIEGHTDNVGNPVTNKALSQKRANAVVKYIVSKGVAAPRLKAVGYGSAKPKANNKTKEGQAENRRVEITLEKAVTKVVPLKGKGK